MKAPILSILRTSPRTRQMKKAPVRSPIAPVANVRCSIVRTGIPMRLQAARTRKNRSRGMRLPLRTRSRSDASAREIRLARDSESAKRKEAALCRAAPSQGGNAQEGEYSALGAAGGDISFCIRSIKCATRKRALSKQRATLRRPSVAAHPWRAPLVVRDVIRMLETIDLHATDLHTIDPQPRRSARGARF